MPFVPNTPESLINRSDSKNPATTCKGIKIDGKHCRRDIAAQKSPGIRRASKTGVVAILPAGDEEHDGAAAYFCWQHKDQAVPLATVGKDGRRADIISLQKRTSVDTLAERLGILSVEDDTNTNGKPKRKRKRHGGRPARKETLPQAWQGIDGQLLAVPERDRPATRPSREKTKPRKKEPSLLSLFCCISSVDVEPPPPPRQRYSSYEKKASVPVQRPSTPRTSGIHENVSPSPVSPFRTVKYDPIRSSSYARSLSKLKIPPEINASLLIELAQPLGLDKPGYIYMFRHTETTQPMLVKIGKTDNVQRRLNEWQAQCGHNLSLIRYYPYAPTSPTQIPGQHPQMVPFVNKVERLIHLELANKKVKRVCGPCGKTHREWFEVSSSKEAIQAVDHTIRRWCEWAMMAIRDQGMNQ